MKEFPERQSIRLPFYDYASGGAYFVTINARGKQPLFGRVVDGEVELNQIGWIAEKKWLLLPDHFPQIALDAYIIMPTHMHGILFIVEEEATVSNRHVRAQHAAPIHDRGPRVAPGSLGAIVRSYKSAVTKAVN